MDRLITYCYEDKCLKVNRFIMNIDADIINKINVLVEEANDAFSKSANLLECIFYFGDAGQNWFRTNIDGEETFGTGDGDVDVILAIRDDFIFSDEDRFFGEYSENFEFHVMRDNYICWKASYEGRLEFETVWIPYWYFSEKIKNIQ